MFRSTDARNRLIDAVSRLAEGLSITGRIPPLRARNGGAWDRRGWTVLESVIDVPLVLRLAALIERLRDARLPSVFLYLTDEAWYVGEVVRDRINDVMGREYLLAADVWAWLIRPGQKGWAPHRGWSADVLDRHAPELVNVWLALVDVTADRSAMHVVPLDDDESYPTNLANIEVPTESARVLPISAGDALAWNANILHWGGACDAAAVGPRLSCSFSLVRATARGEMLLRSVRTETLDVDGRLDLIASQIVTYGADQADVLPEVLEWAQATHALRARLSSMERP